MKIKIIAYIQLLRLNKPIGSLLILWPTLWALFIAGEGRPDIGIVSIFILGLVLMRSAGCAINDFADRKVDGFVQRTKNRPLPSGLVSPLEAVLLFAIPCLIAFLLVLTLNRFTIFLSLAAVVLAVIYPFMKRITHLPQLVLGLAFSWGIPMAFAAQTNAIPAIAWWLVAANICWTIAYDTLYAMVDRNDDLKVGIKSTAILFGQWERFIVFILQLTMLLILVFCGYQLQLTAIFFISLLMVFLLFLYQQWLVKNRDESLCFKAFLHNNYVGMVVFLGLLVHYLSV